MTHGFIGFRLFNLVIPGNPKTLEVITNSGAWQLVQEKNFEKAMDAIQNKNQCAETYSASLNYQIGASRAASQDAALEELLPLCLGASYLVRLSVAPTRALPTSDANFITIGDHFPRPRSMGPGMPSISSATEFEGALAGFIRNFPLTQRIEKARLLVHHWLDALACWSMEDLVLSTATMLEIIAATGRVTANAAGVTLTNFNARLNYAATRYSLGTLSSDFRNMRNDLVHEGTLSGTKFPGKTERQCAHAIAEALHWIDLYMHAALGFGPLIKPRFTAAEFTGLNAFSMN